MALSQDDKQEIAQMMAAAMQSREDDRPAAPEAPAPVIDAASDPANGPDYYVHLANGQVVESKDSGSTHMDVDGEQVAVIGRYQKGA